MALSEDFEAAQVRVKTLSAPPAPPQLLALYGLFKQATKGDATGKRPGMLDVRGRAKHDAWVSRSGLSADDAMQGYITLVDQLLAG